jgi:tRNA dimethylallyltransferase
MLTTDQAPPVICIMGPTAAGKTDLAVALTQRFPADIISVDSAMVYREMDIGTAKPDAATLQLAPHRLIDIRDPAESYSAAQFRSDALDEIRSIHRHHRLPLLVGGTMLYFRTLWQGLSVLPQADPAIRAQLERERQRDGTDALHRRLAGIDPAAAARIHPHDIQRIQRALEVYQVTGTALTELYARKNHQSLPFRFLRIALVPGDRRWLHQRIEQRFYKMLEQGFIGEVEKLQSRSDLGLDKAALRAVGYRQVWKYLQGETDYADMVQQGIAATRQFAKRQLTWLRAEAGLIWLDSLNPDVMGQALTRLEVFLEHLTDS